MDEVFDADLKGIMGDRYVAEKPPISKHEPVADSTEETPDLWSKVKFPLLFLVLVAFLAWTADLDLVDGIVAVPGMCLCSACFGWNLKGGRR